MVEESPCPWKLKTEGDILKSCALFDFLTCGCINSSTNKYSCLKSKEINVVDENKVHAAS